METINAYKPLPLPPVATIDVTPHGAAVSVTTPLGTYTWPDVFNHATSTTLTFTGTVSSMLPVTVAEWYWDFGDGTTGVGNGITHAYLYPDPSLIVNLRVTTDQGVVAYSSLPLMLT